jgi:hypothetical protein
MSSVLEVFTNPSELFEGKHLIRLSLKKVKFLVILLLTLTSTIATISLLPRVKAEVKIISVNPTSGHVGTNVTLTANITTVNRQYKIFFDEMELSGGTATENNVTVAITIPPARAGNHTIKIFDVGSGENATATFEVFTAYLLEISPPIEPPQQRQEGDSVEIRVNVTGGEQDKQFYIANITVQTPTNASHMLKELLNITLSEDGSGSEIIHYPDDFEGANTSYVGEYRVFFNETLATASFTIGLTNATEYHRFQIVDIKAVGYKDEENVTLTITGENVYYSTSLNASLEGVVYANWSVPSNAPIGTYMVNITSTFNVTVKTPPDIQNFTVPGFDVNITARNLAGEPLSDVAIRIFENEVSVENVTSGSDGLVSVKLEIGNFTAEAHFKERKVGESWINVTEAASFDVFCNLTNLRVLVLAVVDGNTIFVPEVKLSLSPENLTLTPTLTTNITGMAVFHSLLTDVTYTLNASRYDMQFNTTELQGLLQNGNPVAWFNLNITCPNYPLQVNVTNPNADNQPISDVTVKVQEFLGGLYFEENTNASGIALFNCPFGKYHVEVYASGIKLNETTVILNESCVVSISCKLYGLNVSVQVVDYFGQPIPNADVILKRSDDLQYSNRTKSDGTADFLGIIGGELHAIIYLPGQSQPYTETTFYVDSATTIQVKVERYVMLAGFLVETGQLATLIIIVVSVIAVLLFEVYRRRHFKPKKAEGEESK